MTLAELQSELQKRNAKLSFREQQELLRSPLPASEAVERHLNPGGRELPELQMGGGNTLYVDPNTPEGRARYQAYRDSTALYNMGETSLSALNSYNEGKISNDALLSVLKKEDVKADNAWENLIKINEKRPTPVLQTYSNDGRYSVKQYPKPTQPVKYKPDPEIVAKQQQLIDAGYPIDKADGIWGPKSKAAWEKYQKPEVPNTQEQASEDWRDTDPSVLEIKPRVIERRLDSSGNVISEQVISPDKAKVKFNPETRSWDKYQTGGPVKPHYVDSENDLRYRAYLDSLDTGKESLRVLQEELNAGNIPSHTMTGKPVREVKDLRDIDLAQTRLISTARRGVSYAEYDPKGVPGWNSPSYRDEMPRTHREGVKNDPTVVMTAYPMMSMSYHSMPRQQVIVREPSMRKETFEKMPSMERFRIPQKEATERLSTSPVVPYRPIYRVNEYTAAGNPMIDTKSSRKNMRVPKGRVWDGTEWAE